MGENSGISVASAGDVNGDGFDRSHHRRPGASPNGYSSGASYVVFGQAGGFAAEIDLADLDGTNGFKISGEAAGDFSGFSVASAGDVNGDGFDDLIIGAPDADRITLRGQLRGVRAGGWLCRQDRAFRSGWNERLPDQRRGGIHTGVSVASAGDVNGDGFDDLIIGATNADPNGTGSGASYVVFGQAGGFAANVELSDLDGTNGFQINGEAAGDYSGLSVASAGDVNGDGFDDLIIGAHERQPERKPLRGQLCGVRAGWGLCRRDRAVGSGWHERLSDQR